MAERGSVAGCQRWFVPTGTWITRSLCHWPTGSSSCTSGKQVRLNLGHQKCSPKVVAVGGWLGEPLGRDAEGGSPTSRERDVPVGVLETPHSEAGGGGHSSPGPCLPWNPMVASVYVPSGKSCLQPPPPIVCIELPLFLGTL